MGRCFDHFQVASLAVFLLLFAGRIVQLRARGIQPLRVVVGKPLPEALLEALLLVALPVWVWEAFASAWPLDAHLFPAALHIVVIDHPAARWTGCLLVGAGLLLFAAALVAFGDAWRVGIDRETPGPLVTGGVFAVSRNPIFLFMDAYALGTFLLNGRLLFGLLALLALLAIHQQILGEEAFLEAQYGDAYRAYRERTPRYLAW